MTDTWTTKAYDLGSNTANVSVVKNKWKKMAGSKVAMYALNW